MMRDDIRDFGTGMMELGVDNRHIAIIGESSYHWICAYFGLMACGAVTVPLDKELPAEDLAATCATAECTAVFYSPAISKKLPGIREALPADTLWVSMGESKEQSSHAARSSTRTAIILFTTMRLITNAFLPLFSPPAPRARARALCSPNIISFPI